MSNTFINSNLEEAFKNSDWSTICAALMPHFNDYLARRSKNVFECEQVNNLDHVFTVPALYDDLAGTRKQVIVPMKVFTKNVDAAVDNVKKATDAANTAADKANTAASNADNARADLDVKKQQVDDAVAASSAATDAAKKATSDTLASKKAIEQNEATRQSAETDRANAETERATNEAARVEVEKKRVTAENARATAETARASAETTRTSNETTRKNQESTRQTQEAARVEAEKKRVSAENVRATAETTRTSNETTRKNQESTRQTQESARVEAEKKRVAAENKRETDFSASKDACDDATEKANSTYSHPPYVDRDGYYYKWNVTTSSYDKTDVNLTGKAFQIKKVFASVSAMNATDVNTFAENDFILINTVDVEDADNAKLYVVAMNEQGQKFYSYLVDMSGFRGFTGKTPQFIIGNVTTLAEDADAAASISSSGTDTDGNPVYKLNLGIPMGKRLRFADLTDSDKAELMKPATDAAAESKTQTAACKTATDNANTAAIKATTAATNADKATAAANTATAAANTATTNANTAATNAGEATESSKTQTALAKELNEHPQKQGDNGNWWKWNTTTKMYEDTGIPAKGGMLYPSMWIDGNALYLEDNESSAASHLSYDGNALYLVI